MQIQIARDRHCCIIFYKKLCPQRNLNIFENLLPFKTSHLYFDCLAFTLYVRTAITLEIMMGGK